MTIPGDISFKVKRGSFPKKGCKALFVSVFSDELPPKPFPKTVERFIGPVIKRLHVEGEIKGSFKEFTIERLENAPFRWLMLIGLGKKKDYCLDKIRSVAARAARTLRRIGCDQMTIVPGTFPDFSVERVAEVITEGIVLGLYKFEKFRSKLPKRSCLQNVMFLVDNTADEKAVKTGVCRGELLGRAANTVRDLINTPGNILTPPVLVETARSVADKSGLDIEVFDQDELERRGMNGILNVAKGSRQPPFLVTLKYRGAKRSAAPWLALLGKGITFDTGGISLKRSQGMQRLKYDMAGAATVLTTLEVVAKLGLPVNLMAIMPIAENMPDGGAYKPGDVVKMYNGMYVEISDTDAEGRLLLADALTHAVKEGASVLVDVATLTGSVVSALGHMATGVMGRPTELIRTFIEAGKKCDEYAWRLPLMPEYAVQLKSLIADIRNEGGRPAGASIGGMFLRNFTGGLPWVHADIVGTAWIDENSFMYYHKSYLPKRGATGVMARTLINFVELMIPHLASKKKLAEFDTEEF
jgi:leucyl aminopeptidase